MKKLFHIFFSGILQTLVILCAIFVILYLFVISPHIVDGFSMFPTFHNGDVYFANEFIYKLSQPQRGDVIVFQHNETQDFIKRIIGLPGDTIEVTNGSIYINGLRLDESTYIQSTNLTYGLDFLHDNTTITVPTNKYFVLGDNREESSDSREWGFVDASAIKGKVWLAFWPLSSLQISPNITYIPKGDILVAK